MHLSLLFFDKSIEIDRMRFIMHTLTYHMNEAIYLTIKDSVWEKEALSNLSIDEKHFLLTELKSAMILRDGSGSQLTKEQKKMQPI